MSRTVTPAADGPQGLTWPSKDPSEVLDYTIDWSQRLGPDQLASATMVLVSGTSATLVVGSVTHTATTATSFISVGAAGDNAQITCTGVSSGGRTMIETVRLPVRSN